MDALEDLGDELGPHATERTLDTTLGEDLVVARGLEDGHVVLLLVVAYLAAYAHTLGEDVHDLVVELVNLLTQADESLGGGVLVADDEQRQILMNKIF